jgi:hypothetical protein
MGRGVFFVERKISQMVALTAFHPQTEINETAIDAHSGDEGYKREDHHPVVEDESFKHVRSI